MSDLGGRLIRLTIVVLAASMLWACEGDDGRDGAAGAAGGAGPAGPPGPPGPTGGTGGVPVDSAEKINIEVTSVTVPAGGGAPVVEVRLTNDLTQGLVGLPAGDIRFMLSQLSPAPAAGGSSEWQSYVTRSSGGIADAQATTERGSAGTFVDNGDGTYQYTYAQALTAYPAGPTFDATKTHRLGIEIRGQAPISTNGIFDFVPAGGAPMFERKVVDNDTCNACHDVLNFHGGPRTDVEYCVTCHNPYSIDGDTGNTVDMKAMIHNIHVGRDGYVVIGFGGTVHDYSDIQFTQDVRNCQTCHEENDADTPQASNWRLVSNRAACGTCHYDVDGVADGDEQYMVELGEHPGGPGGLTFTDDTQCVDCHGPNGTVTDGDGRLVQVPVAHELREVIANEAFAYEVVSVTNTAPGDTPVATIRVTNPLDGTTYDINDPTGPFQIGSSRLNLDISWTTTALGNLDPNDTLGRAPDSGAPFAPIQIGFQSGAVDDGNGNFTKAASDAIPTGITGSGLAVLEGRAAVDVDGSLDNLPVSSEVLDFAITDATAQERRSVVDIDKCNDCHKNLALHGDNRSGNTEVCSTCHNPNATDIQRRVVGSECDIGRPPGTNGPDDPGVVGLGLEDAPIDMKRMIHMIHAGAIGVCGYRNSAHPYFGVVYPGRLNNCEGCHVPGEDTYYPVDPAVILATSIDAGADRSSLLDDVAISPNTSVCSSCHTSALAAEHMKQNGGDFEAGKMEDGSLVSEGVETCALCHGEGRSSDVGAVHGVGEFQFN